MLAGTNAPGTALHLDRAVQIHSAEHFNRLVQPWSCAAAPIHDPTTNQILGLVDITGGADVGSPQTLGLVRAAARMAESELARIAAVEGRTGAGHDSAQLWAPGPAPLLRLHGLGRPECLLDFGDLAHRLSPRHSDIVVALVDHPDGLTAEQLELEVYAGRVHPSTIRAEMTRLRALLGPNVLQSRIANDTLYGLGAGVWSRDGSQAYRAGREIQAGRVWTNCYHQYPAHAAFGGYKQSGVGRENHKMMLDHYQNTKNLLVSYSPKALGFF